MKILLFHPPVGNLCQPYLSLPALVGFLKQQGIREVAQYDFNLEILDTLLSPERLERTYRWCRHAVWKQLRTPPRSDIEAMHTRLMIEILDRAPQTIRDINRAKCLLRSTGFYDAERYRSAVRTVEDAYRLLTARWFPTVLDHQSLTMRYRLDATDDVLAAVADREENCFIGPMEERLAEVLESEGAPDIAGVSIGAYEQLVPGLTLASLIKRAAPATHVTLGGTLMSALVAKPLRADLFDLFDSIVFFEGELPLLSLIEAIASGQDLAQVPSLAYRRGREVFRTPVAERPASVAALPRPDFSGLPLERYLSPSPILPLAGSRGCYWRKCTFCTRQHLIDTYRKRPLDQLFADITSLRGDCGAQGIFFVDECMSPSTLNALAERILSAGLRVSWSCYVRFEAPLADPALCRKLAASGLRMLYFGLESACQRVLDLMRKGTEKQTMARILDAVASAGIETMILYFVGFPTETRDEALETMDFLLDNRRNVGFAIAGQFLLEESSPIFADPKRFGITEVRPMSPRSDLGIIYDYQTESGMSPREAAAMKELINARTRALHDRVFLNRSHLLLTTPASTALGMDSRGEHA